MQGHKPVSLPLPPTGYTNLPVTPNQASHSPGAASSGSSALSGMEHFAGSRQPFSFRQSVGPTWGISDRWEPTSPFARVRACSVLCAVPCQVLLWLSMYAVPY